MRFPNIEGLIRRRVLVNFRVDPAFIQTLLPAPLRPQIVGGAAQAGICLIRLERMRMAGWPSALGFSSENAAHRIAVEWDARDGVQRAVYIPRRDTSSPISRLAGGRLFPGAHHLARFDIRDDGRAIAFAVTARDGRADIALRARAATAMPRTSTFTTLSAASAFFQRGSLGYSPTGHGYLDGIRLVTQTWNLQPLDVEHVRSSWFGDVTRFPPGSVEFDSALVMRDTESRWVPLPNLPLADAGVRMNHRSIKTTAGAGPRAAT